MGYSNFENIDGEYCTRKACPDLGCKSHTNKLNELSSQSGISYTVTPIYKYEDCTMAQVYRNELIRNEFIANIKALTKIQCKAK